eukprot:CCRYP_008532-RB/>CCRYP_008532-RB protein AED:0.07 eAED:0.07 QI:129/1/1/1/0.83/0.71/7/454/716
MHIVIIRGQNQMKMRALIFLMPLLLCFRYSIAQVSTNAPSVPRNPAFTSGMPLSTFGPTTGGNTVNGTLTPINPPTNTPSRHPSFDSPTSTIPTAPPFTVSSAPTESPTISAKPTSRWPSILVSLQPSTQPSYSAAQTVTASYTQRLLVTTSQTFSSEQTQLFQFLYERYTSSFGYNSSAEILTECEITRQTISQDPANVTFFSTGFINRRIQEAVFSLSLRFTMEYRSYSAQFNISDYGILFKAFINQNTTKVAEDMARIGLPTVVAGEVIMFTSSHRPTSQPTFVTLSPSLSGSPSSSPTLLPSGMPSSSPTDDLPTVNVVSKSFALGTSLGIVGACVVAFMYYIYRLHRENTDESSARPPSETDTQKIEYHGEDEESAAVTEAPNPEQSTAVENKPKQHELSAPMFDIETAVLPKPQSENHPPERQLYLSETSTENNASLIHFIAEGLPQSALFSSERVSEMFPEANNVAMIHSASFSSSNEGYNDEIQHADSFNDSFHPSVFDGSTDELDNYKNQDIEVFRKAVEGILHDVDGMMMLAVTKALTESHLISDNGCDNNSLEAECLYQTFDWWKKNEKSMIDSRDEYFQDLLNKIVAYVFYGSIPPLQGSQIVHGCAKIIGLPRSRDLPQTTLIIQGMLKTNDLVLGQQCIRNAFNHFGAIEAAAIAPNNHGFGFVRFVQAKSAQRALRAYRDSEIVIQDVAVSIKALKSDGLL